MEKLINALTSMRAMAFGLFIFLVAIAVATFIESNETTQASKLWVYNAKWFEILLAFLSVNLIVNIFRHKMWRREKIAVFMFHLSFLVIIIGAWVTRYISYEGIMPIREGAVSNMVYTSDPYLWVNINDGKMQYTHDVKAYMAESYPFNSANMNIDFPGHKNEVQIRYVDFKSNHIDTIKLDPSYKTSALDIVTDGMKSNYVVTDEVGHINGMDIAFSEKSVKGINVYRRNDTLRMKSFYPVQYIPMTEMQKARQSGMAPPDSAFVQVAPNEEIVFRTTTLYQIPNGQFVFKQEIPNAGKVLVPAAKKGEGNDYLTIRITDGNQSKEIQLEGGVSKIGAPAFFQFNGLNYHIEYGMKRVKIPFYMKCTDFMLKKYPGSEMASSYASDLQVIDSANNEFGHKIVFMNHVLDYGGYRFFQSSYDQDEKGTVLSVNHDFWGTNITYLGYLLMMLGMMFSLITPHSRFRELLKGLTKNAGKTSFLIAFTLLSTSLFAQDAAHNHEGHDHDHDHDHSQEQASAPKNHSNVVYFMSEEHSDELASLLVQDNRGRIVPVHTMCGQILKKLYRSDSYEGKNAVQVVLSMHMYPDYWMNQKIILVPKALFEKYKLSKYASLSELMDESGNFKWIDDYNTAVRKAESKQSEIEKKLIKLGEKFQIVMMIMSWDYMKIIPLKGDPRHNWYMPFSSELLSKDTVTSKLALRYISSINDQAKANGSFEESSKLLKELKIKQRELSAKEILPSETHVNIEVSYNKMNVFSNSMKMYLVFGLVLLILYFVRVFFNPSQRSENNYKRISSVIKWLTFIVFVYHAIGLGMRSYVSGHAPWSDGYEAMVYIAWVAVLGGFIFTRYSVVVLSVAMLFSAFFIMVSQLNLLDPEITPLEPVLKSYWLMIHVAIITSSYAFLGISFFLGIVNFVLFIARNEKNGKALTNDINTLTAVSEMSIIVGLFMLSAGTFLGGIWANESWGRYWGWDPKETWALVSMLVYAIIMHFRYIPGMKSKFVFNVGSVWGYSAILFTFFGVNFILVGLHSYANGEGSTNLPISVWISIFAFLILTIVAGIKNKSYLKLQKTQL